MIGSGCIVWIASAIGTFRTWSAWLTMSVDEGDTVAKVFSGQRTKFFRTADALHTRRGEGPHRFAQKRPRTFVSGLASIAVVETSKHRLSRDFQRRSIFDFCNSICQQETLA